MLDSLVMNFLIDLECGSNYSPCQRVADYLSQVIDTLAPVVLDESQQISKNFRGRPCRSSR